MNPHDSEGADAFARELAEHLRATGRAERARDSFRVDEVLKAGAAETTEIVYHMGANGDEVGPIVRKRIARESGLGGAYEAIYQRQRSGTRFAHLPLLLGVHTDDERTDVLMEYVPGETLDQLVGRVSASPLLARLMLPAVAAAVTELHEAFDPPLIHRDLKPSNVIVSFDDAGSGRRAMPQATLIDFGIARAWREGAEADTVHFGTRSYAPPEQFGFGQTDVRSDVYALGMLTAFCATGSEPQAGLDAAALQAAGVDEALASVILRATAFDPAARYASAAEFARAVALEDGAVDEEPMRRASSQPESGARPAAASAAATLGGLRALLARVPAGVGTAWNALLLATALLVLMATPFAVNEPTGVHVEHPAWFCGLEYLSFLDIPCMLFCWCAADHRRLLSRIPALSRLPRGRLLLIGTIASLLCFTALTLAWELVG